MPETVVQRGLLPKPGTLIVLEQVAGWLHCRKGEGKHMDSSGSGCRFHGKQTLCERRSAANAGVITLGTGASALVNIGRTGDNSDPFAGLIDDLRLYKRALSQSDIQSDRHSPV